MLVLGRLGSALGQKMSRNSCHFKNCWNPKAQEEMYTHIESRLNCFELETKRVYESVRTTTAKTQYTVQYVVDETLLFYQMKII